jgi:hypothetical protein
MIDQGCHRALLVSSLGKLTRRHRWDWCLLHHGPRAQKDTICYVYTANSLFMIYSYPWFPTQCRITKGVEKLSSCLACNITHLFEIHSTYPCVKLTWFTGLWVTAIAEGSTRFASRYGWQDGCLAIGLVLHRGDIQSDCYRIWINLYYLWTRE